MESSSLTPQGCRLYPHPTCIRNAFCLRGTLQTVALFGLSASDALISTSLDTLHFPL